MKALISLMIFALSTPSVSAEEFGRLFTSPQERLLLDNKRRKQPDTPIDSVLKIEQATQNSTDVLPTQLRFSGYVKRSDGLYVVWVNGISALSGPNLPVERVRFSEDSNKAILETNLYRARMAPGQVWSLEDNTVAEGYLSNRKPKL
ncbi:MAG: hypothetical protein ACI9PN_000630 [Candidatus Azotimanducaceae bacterium]|jgi:hypothetical protein